MVLAEGFATSPSGYLAGLLVPALLAGMIGLLGFLTRRVVNQIDVNQQRNEELRGQLTEHATTLAITTKLLEQHLNQSERSQQQFAAALEKVTDRLEQTPDRRRWRR